MPKAPSDFPTELELRILKILWESHPRKVRDVRSALAEQGHEIAHTSVISTLNNMVEKGFLKRKPEGNALLFSPAIQREKVHGGMLDDLKNRVFDGSASALMLSLIEHEAFDEQELKDLRKLINKKLAGEA